MESINAVKGILTMTVVEGNLKRDTEMFGKMSPFCMITHNGKSLKTKCHNNGGKTPKWGDCFVLEILDATEDLKLRVWDQDLNSKDALGFALVRLAALMFDGGTT